MKDGNFYTFEEFVNEARPKKSSQNPNTYMGDQYQYDIFTVPKKDDRIRLVIVGEVGKGGLERKTWEGIINNIDASTRTRFEISKDMEKTSLPDPAISMFKQGDYDPVDINIKGKTAEVVVEMDKGNIRNL